MPAGRTGWDLTGRAAAFGAGAGLALAAAAVAGYVGVVTGAAPLDVARGRRTRALGPLSVHVAAPRELVFDLIAAPYLGRPTRATAAKLTLLERGADMVLAEHYTPVSGGLRATTTETVRFERPDRVTFRLVRGPVPYVVEEFILTPSGGGTSLTYAGTLGTDFGAAGAGWGRIVAAKWEAVVASSVAAVRSEAERRAGLAG
ncbi:MAG: SRPBCC family protein [Mycobacteriales bacterium]